MLSKVLHGGLNNVVRLPFEPSLMKRLQHWIDAQSRLWIMMLDCGGCFKCAAHG
jgi:hypothetical protein